MCFLYRQSISIVYESKFKYIYRYFIKIDRCFCGILLSLPLRKCGLKYQWYFGVLLRQFVTSLAEVWIEISQCFRYRHKTFVTSLAEVWIEISLPFLSSVSLSSLPLRKCGLKLNPQREHTYFLLSLPLRKCGLKSACKFLLNFFQWSLPLRKCGLKFRKTAIKREPISHFPCGSVDWNKKRSLVEIGRSKSLPLRKCGLKCLQHLMQRNPYSHFPCGSVDWNFDVKQIA